MGVAAYNRGTKVLRKQADAAMPSARESSMRARLEDENAALRASVAKLEHDLKRARRCLASERLGRESLADRLRRADSAHHFTVRILCKLAFPNDER